MKLVLTAWYWYLAVPCCRAWGWGYVVWKTAQWSDDAIFVPTTQLVIDPIYSANKISPIVCTVLTFIWYLGSLQQMSRYPVHCFVCISVITLTATRFIVISDPTFTFVKYNKAYCNISTKSTVLLSAWLKKVIFLCIFPIFTVQYFHHMN